MRLNTKILISALLAISFVIGVVGYKFLTPSTSIEIPGELSAVLRTYQTELKPFNLVNHHNQAFGLEQLKDRQSLVFFGYTSCPDVCPMTLTALNSIYNILKKNNLTNDLQVVFVSLDPERDSIEKLSEYVNYFNPEFIALTGKRDELDNFIKQFAAGYFIEPGETEDTYLINHASSIFLVDKNSKLIAAFSPPHKPSVIADQYQHIQQLFSSQNLDH